MLEHIETFKYKPLISILMPVYNTPEKYLREAIDSVRNQVYTNWELCIADDGSCSRYEWAKTILELDPDKDTQIANAILSASSSEIVTAAERPLRSILSCKKFEGAFGLPLPDWHLALQLAMRS